MALVVIYKSTKIEVLQNIKPSRRGMKYGLSRSKEPFGKFILSEQGGNTGTRRLSAS